MGMIVVPRVIRVGEVGFAFEDHRSGRAGCENEEEAFVVALQRGRAGGLAGSRGSVPIGIRRICFSR